MALAAARARFSAARSTAGGLLRSTAAARVGSHAGGKPYIWTAQATSSWDPRRDIENEVFVVVLSSTERVRKPDGAFFCFLK
jgi:hypothetical protein